MPQGGYPIPPAELVVGPFGGEWFVSGGSETEIDGKVWDILGVDRSTRDAGVVHTKVDYLVALMGQYFKEASKAA